MKRLATASFAFMLVGFGSIWFSAQRVKAAQIDAIEARGMAVRFGDVAEQCTARMVWITEGLLSPLVVPYDGSPLVDLREATR